MILAQREYKLQDVIAFAKTDGKFGGLSNMAPGYNLFVNEINIQSSEILYQACRFPLFPHIQEELIRTQNPMDSKSVSRKYATLTRQDWDIVRFRIMRWCLEVKLIQNFPKFSELLLSTGDKPIVEYSTKDSLWGAIPQSKEILVGVNALGRLLMELRAKIQTGALIQASVIYPLDIPAFLLFNNKISEVHNDDYFIHDLDEIYAY
ncbi:NADAR family protein [Chitinophaga rhizophila]|uniref:NADAR family protein n=1 Tax=Chitinophaga rhizophila TaxID=2866212 RepID=A0ABS7GJ67_9BACT|nr:NADAR family protein [Chitinophaga rhizophila]MBW8687746.1 NADAR family protein [Chitinophaga rhizophila]